MGSFNAVRPKNKCVRPPPTCRCMQCAPHYETIAPDGRRVHGYDVFGSELQRLQEKLK